jgi:hypothetical protein
LQELVILSLCENKAGYLCAPCAPPQAQLAGSPPPIPSRPGGSLDLMPPVATAVSAELMPLDTNGSANFCMPLAHESLETEDAKLRARHFKVIQRSHQRCGHMGEEKTLDAVRKHLEKSRLPTWDSISKDVTHFSARSAKVTESNSLST